MAHLRGESDSRPLSSKLRFYKLFKTMFVREPYLADIPNFLLRKRLTKFRCSDHSLEIEVGRHKNIPAQERICKMCKDGIETEEHFLWICPKYSQLRTRYFGDVNLEWADILKCSNKNSSYSLANYITKALKYRESILANS